MKPTERRWYDILVTVDDPPKKINPGNRPLIDPSVSYRFEVPPISGEVSHGHALAVEPARTQLIRENGR